MRKPSPAAIAVATILLRPAVGFAQQEVPNPMASHTLFVILIGSAFLVWAASYSFHFYQDRRNRPTEERRALAHRREALLDEMAELESGYEAGTIGESRYKHRRKAIRSELARTIGKLASSGTPPGTRPSGGARS